MALSTEERKELLAVHLPSTRRVQGLLSDYLARTGLTPADFGRRINYSRASVTAFLNGSYAHVAATDGPIRKAITEFIAAHPVAIEEYEDGTLYETQNVRLLRQYFNQALSHHRAIYVHGDPGSQKSYVLQHLVVEVNRAEVAKAVRTQGAFYIYCRDGIRPNDLLKRVAEAAGVSQLGNCDRILRNLRFEWRGLRIVLVFDEAQHLRVDCFETVRELLDRPPYCGLLFAGSHQLQSTFTLNALQLEQWNSRFHFGKALPGITEQEAGDILRAEFGSRLKAADVQDLINKSRAQSLRGSGAHTYISARRLFWSIRDIKEKVSPSAPAAAPQGGVPCLPN